MILRVAVVAKRNYRDLKKLCHPNVVGENYSDFLRIVDKTLEHAKILDIETVRVPIDPPKFAYWLGDRKAKRIDLLHYADMIHRNPFNHDEPRKAVASSTKNTERRTAVRR